MPKSKTTAKSPLGDFDFECEGCKTVHHKSSYCIAQQASGNEIVFTCPKCNTKMTVPE